MAKKWKRLRHLHIIEWVISLFRHCWDAVGPRVGPWAGAAMSALAGAWGAIMSAPAWAYVVPGLALFLSALGIWDYRMGQREKEATVPAVPGPRIAPPKPVPAPSATIKQDVMSAPAVWITEDEALWMVCSSSSVQSRLPAEPLAIDKVVRALAGSPMTLRDRRANEISSHLLRKFKTDRPSGAHSGLYDRQRLEEWINQQAYDDPPTKISG